MKKILTAIATIALCLTLVCAACAEEELNFEQITVELDESYAEAPLGEEYAVTRVPGDWIVVEAAYADETSKLLGAYVNPNGTQLLMVTLAETGVDATNDSLYSEAVANNIPVELIEVNGLKFIVLSTSAEGNIVLLANFLVGEEETSVITFTFSFPEADAEAMEQTVNQILGAFKFVTAE